MDSDDEMPTLSSFALNALKEFQNEEKERKEKFAKMFEDADKDFSERSTEKAATIDDFKEDWQLSQFWYSDETANILADELIDGADSDTVICIVSAPSVYAALINKPQPLPTEHIYLFEYDNRFKVLAREKFGFYDYNKPLEFREDLKGKIDRLLIDPPFLESECQTKSSMTAKALLNPENKDHRLISCTGERMAELIKEIYPSTHITSFFPEHKNGLSNEFRCYANYEGKNWSFQA